MSPPTTVGEGGTRAPLLQSTSLDEFWGRRWNLAFSDMAQLALRAGLPGDLMALGALDTMNAALTPAEVMDLVPVRPLAEFEPAVLEQYRARLGAVMERIRPA